MLPSEGQEWVTWPCGNLFPFADVLWKICHEVLLPNWRNKISPFCLGLMSIFSYCVLWVISVLGYRMWRRCLLRGRKTVGSLEVPGTLLPLILLSYVCVCVGGACSSLSTDQQRTLWSGRLKVRVVGSACQSLALPSGDLGVFLSGNPGCKQESAGRTTSSIISALWGTGWSSRACSWFLDLFTGIWSFLRPGIFCLLA